MRSDPLFCLKYDKVVVCQPGGIDLVTVWEVVIQVPAVFIGFEYGLALRLRFGANRRAQILARRQMFR